MYGIIHKEIFESTIMAEGYEIVYVFISMITLADNQDCVKMTPATLSLRINMPLEKTQRALERLSLPDQESESRNFEGRRIIPISELFPEYGRGWFIVNREKYIEKAKKERRRVYMRDLMKERREIANNANKEPLSANKPHGVNPQLTHIDVNINIDINKDINKKAWEEFIQHRKDIKQSLSELSIQKNLKVLSGYSLDQQQQMVDQTIANRWRGLFPLKNQRKENGNGVDTPTGTSGKLGRAAQAFKNFAEQERAQHEQPIQPKPTLPSH